MCLRLQSILPKLLWVVEQNAYLWSLDQIICYLLGPFDVECHSILKFLCLFYCSDDNQRRWGVKIAYYYWVYISICFYFISMLSMKFSALEFGAYIFSIVIFSSALYKNAEPFFVSSDCFKFGVYFVRYQDGNTCYLNSFVGIHFLHHFTLR